MSECPHRPACGVPQTMFFTYFYGIYPYIAAYLASFSEHIDRKKCINVLTFYTVYCIISLTGKTENHCMKGKIMKKTVKKVLCILLVFAFVFGMAAVSVAEGETYFTSFSVSGKNDMTLTFKASDGSSFDYRVAAVILLPGDTEDDNLAVFTPKDTGFHAIRASLIPFASIRKSRMSTSSDLTMLSATKSLKLRLSKLATPHTCICTGGFRMTASRATSRLTALTGL